ncbi:MAG TPA: hypothetical protein VFT76_00260 [Actinomycetota bacterium]|nr:hypothetical protein [Actinomycetota bacterium]
MRREILVGVLEVLGAAAVLVGVARIYEPAAWVLGGIAALLLAIFLEGGLGSRGKRGGRRG